MARGKNRKNQQPKPAARTIPATPQKNTEPEKSTLQSMISSALGRSEKAVPEGEVVPPLESIKPEDLTLDECWNKAQQIEENYQVAIDAANVQKKSASEAEKAFTERQQELTEKSDLLEDEKQRLNEERESLNRKVMENESQQTLLEEHAAQLDSRENALRAKEAEVLKREESVKDRELNAEADFLQQRKASLAKLEEEEERIRVQQEERLAQLHEKLKEVKASIDSERANWMKESRERSEKIIRKIQEQKDEYQAKLSRQKQALRDDYQQKQNELLAEQKRLKDFERRLKMDEEALLEEREELEERVTRATAKKKESFDFQVASLESQLAQARSDRDNLQQQLDQRAEADRRFGQRTPEDALARLQQLEKRNKELKEEIASRLDNDAGERLRMLEEESTRLRGENIQFVRERNEARLQLQRQHTAAIEMEALRDQKIAAEERIRVLEKGRDELRSEIDGLVEQSEAAQPFPACSAMDGEEFQNPFPASEEVDDLESFTKDLQQRIAYGSEGKSDQLFYSLEDLRAFLGGLAMSKLTLLQGISGTGKTSLPIAFARAMGTPFEDRDILIQVQAGWRDPQDLVGHYNAFEKQFNEQTFLSALYRASTPKYRDLVYIIVLDEMNLSHPEQYFSDMLSTMELKPEKRFIKLMNHGLNNAPTLFHEGKHLLIPENVWFVGTANHDETTKDFADKTYDRSQVMEFNEIPKSFEVKPPEPRSPVSYNALQLAFTEAQRKLEEIGEEVSLYLNSELKEQLLKDFGIGWGPRFEQQLRRYCPVVTAAGGSVGEAADHLLAMRLLRKLRNRHDNRQDSLERLRGRIAESWLDGDSEPNKSLSLLKGELRRLGVETED